MTLDSATVDGAPARVVLDETLARVDLTRPLAPGDSAALRVHFRVHVPKPFDRFGRTGDSYAMGQWYPKLVVLDPEGWALDPYHYFAEFYGEFGDFDVAITLPDDQWVGATGSPDGAEGGDNEVPLQKPRADSVTVHVAVVLADSLAGRWPGKALRLEPLQGNGVAIKREEGASWRVPSGAPAHYRYRWEDAIPRGASRDEADADGRARPLRRVTAAHDTSIVDTLRALAAPPADADSALPSLKTLRFHAARVHDFAWVSSPRYVRADTTWNGIAVRSLIFREDTTAWRRSLSMTVRALEHHTARVGPYVWPRFTTAEAMTAGGAMEYPMLIMNDPDLTQGEVDYLDPTLAHESAHNWFYGMLANDERRHPWLDEGFAQFLEDDYADRYYPDGLWKLRRHWRWVSPLRWSDAAERQVLERHEAKDEQPPSLPADAATSYPRYAIAAYARPAAMLRTLQAVWGDSAFASFLHAVYRRSLLRHLRPDDVYAAAREAAGEGAPAQMKAWIETTRVPDFALGRIRRERTPDGWRARVAVLRKGEIAFPVPVEARFADGSAETKIVPTDARENEVVFESRARLRSAAIDPRRTLFDAYRLDNRSGLLPPMRWRPVFDIQQTDAYSVLYGPTLWHGSMEGMRLGGWFEGRYLSNDTFPRGIRSFEGGLGVGADDGTVFWRAGVARHLEPLGTRGTLKLLVAHDARYRRGEITLANRVTGSGKLHPWRSWELTIQDLRDERAARITAGWDTLSIPPAYRYGFAPHTLNARLTLRLDTKGPRRAETWSAALWHGVPVRSGALGSWDEGYDRGFAELRQQLDLGPHAGLHVAWRAAAGAVWRNAPSDRLLDGVQATPLETLDRFYLNDGGPLRESEHYWAEGGGGLRGYVGRTVVGDRLLAGSLDLRRDRWPVSFFADVGRVDIDPAARVPGRLTVGRALADAGLGYRVGILRLDLPFWVSTPARGEHPWDVRWVVSFDVPDLRFR